MEETIVYIVRGGGVGCGGLLGWSRRGGGEGGLGGVGHCGLRRGRFFFVFIFLGGGEKKRWLRGG